LDRRVGHLEPFAERIEADPNLARRHLVDQDRFALEDGIQRREPLLSVHDEQRRRRLLYVDADGVRLLVGRSLPEEEEPGGVARVQRVEEISHLSAIPHEGPLELWQPDLPRLDLTDQRADWK